MPWWRPRSAAQGAGHSRFEEAAKWFLRDVKGPFESFFTQFAPEMRLYWRKRRAVGIALSCAEPSLSKEPAPAHEIFGHFLAEKLNMC
jgi:hypothetical protein